MHPIINCSSALCTPAASMLSLMKRKLTGGEESSISLTTLTFGPLSCLRFLTTCFLRAPASIKAGRGEATRMTGVVRILVLVEVEEVVAPVLGFLINISKLELRSEDCLFRFFLEPVVVERSLERPSVLVVL